MRSANTVSMIACPRWVMSAAAVGSVLLVKNLESVEVFPAGPKLWPATAGCCRAARRMATWTLTHESAFAVGILALDALETSNQVGATQGSMP
jgi:hypothetical protein